MFSDYTHNSTRLTATDGKQSAEERVPRATVAKTEAKEARIEVNIFLLGVVLLKPQAQNPNPLNAIPGGGRKGRGVCPLELFQNMGWKALTIWVGKP